MKSNTVSLKQDERLLNITANPKHNTLEAEIRAIDNARELSRSAMFYRFVQSGISVTNWYDVYNVLMRSKIDPQVPQFRNYQARYDEETANALTEIKQNMVQDLKKENVITKHLHTQFVLQLLMCNYLEELKAKRLALSEKTTRSAPTEEEVTLPMLNALLMEIALLDRDAEELKTVRDALLSWKRKRRIQ